jgi:hypothetical protein
MLLSVLASRWFGRPPTLSIWPEELRIMSRLNRIERRLTEGSSVERQREAARSLPFLREQEEQLARRADAKLRLFRREEERRTGAASSTAPFIDDQASWTSSLMVAIAWMALGIEVALGGALSVLVLDLHPMLSLALGAVFAVSFTYTSKLLWWPKEDDLERPDGTLLVRQRWLWVTGSVVVVFMGLIAVLRATSLDRFALVFGLGPLSFLLPLLAGGLFAVAKLVRTRNDLARDHHGTSDVLARIRRLIALCLQLLTVPAAPVAEFKEPPNLEPERASLDGQRLPQHSPVLGPMALMVLVVLVQSLVFLPVVSTAAAQPAAQARAGATVTAPPTFVDVSGSLDRLELNRAISLVGQALAIGYPGLDVGLHVFGAFHDIGRGPVAVLRVPAGQHPPCPDRVSNDLTAFLRSAARERDAGCRNAAEVADLRSGLMREAFSRKFEAVFKDQLDKAHPQVTCLDQAMTQAGQYGFSVVLTDGANRRCDITLPVSAPSGVVAVVLVRPAGEGDVQRWAEDVERLRNRFPTSRMTMSFRITSPLDVLRLLDGRLGLTTGE